MTGLKLLAQDAGDLDVISAAVQDGLVRARDFAFTRKARRFTMSLQRFRWERAKARGPFERIQSVLAFESVLSLRSRRLRREEPDAFAQILLVSFTPDDAPPGGEVRIVLAGDGEIALKVECLDATLMDVGEPWRTQRRPDHERGEGGSP